MTRAKLPQDLSHHFRLLTLLATLGVVYIHATTARHDPTLPHGSLVIRLEGYFAHDLFHAALPIFFIISAYLLFAAPSHSMLPRLTRLVSPYLVWSGVWLLVVVALGRLEAGGHAPSLHHLLARLIIDPVPGQLWFLRDLIVLTAAAPLIGRLPKPVLFLGAAVATGWWGVSPTPTVIDLRGDGLQAIVSNLALGWFLCGAAVARACPPDVLASRLRSIPKALPVVLATLWLACPLLPLPMPFDHTLSVTAGAAAALLGLRPMGSIAADARTATLSSYGFFIYLAHHPAIALVTALLVADAEGRLAVHLAVFAVVPPIIMGLLVILAAAMGHFAPMLLRALCGGRRVLALRPAYYRNNRELGDV